MKSRIKQNIHNEFQQKWISQIKDLTVQGRFLELLHLEQSHLSWRSLIYDLPRGILQFAINATIDTLATNANLKRWGKKTNSNCKCGQKETLHHILNNCPNMLERYGWRHDSILRTIYSHISTDPSIETFVDLPNHMLGVSTIPTDILITNLRPDLVILNRSEKAITLFELSVPFETNITATHLRKVQRYETLIFDLENSGYNVSYYAFEIGSRGFISKENLARLKSVFHKFSKSKNHNEIRKCIMKISLLCSFVIYHSKFDEHWIQPAYVKFDIL